MRIRIASLVLLATALTACGGETAVDLVNPGGLSFSIPPGNGTSSVFHCLYTDLCDELSASLSSTEQSTFSSSCTSYGGMMASGHCPTSGALSGTCTFTGDPLVYGVSGDWTTHYYAPPFDATSAQANCSAIPGTWVP